MKTVATIASVLMLAAWPLVAEQSAATKPADAADVPMTKVVLFSSGVGYFEHNGSIKGDADVRLSFKTDQINDVLKSMLVMSDKSFVTSVNYASRDPLIRALKSFAIDVSGDPTMADLLKQVRGAEVVLMAPDKITGKIVSIESRQKSIIVGGAPTILTEVVLNVMTAGRLKAIPMDTIQSLELTDARLQTELSKALELLITSRDTERKPVDLHFAGKGDSSVKIGYITETPVWKTSYRLDLAPLASEKKDAAKKAILQGWAIVENTSDQDWTNVKLSLISGRPISFIQDLYTPLYLPRPVVVPDLYAGLRPQMYDEGIAGKDKTLREGGRGQGWGYNAPGATAGGPRPNMTREQAGDLSNQQYSGVYNGGGPTGGTNLDASKLETATTAGKIGELFQFTLERPVTLPRMKSAMLPIMDTGIAAEKVSIYNQAVLARHALNGIYLTNDTGLKMLGGPITVLDDGMYAGDARIDNIAPKDRKLISYAVDLNMTIDPSQTSTNRITAAAIVRGVLRITRLYTYSQTYKIKNTDTKKRTLIIEYPFDANRKLIEPEKFEEKTAALYRFRVDVDKDSTKDFTVKEEQTVSETIGILENAIDAFVYYAKSDSGVPDKVRAVLSEAIAMKNQLAQTEAKLADLENRLRTIEAGQGRLRENIASVGRDSQLGQRYVKKLSEEEDQIETLRKQIDETRAQVQEQRKKMGDYLKDLSA